MRNEYAGYCIRCGARVEKGAGHPERRNGRWVVRCPACVGKGNKPIDRAAIARATEG